MATRTSVELCKIVLVASRWRFIMLGLRIFRFTYPVIKLLTVWIA